MRISRLTAMILLFFVIGIYGCGGGGDGDQSSPPLPVDSGGGNGGGGGGDVIPLAPTGVSAASGENGKATLSWNTVDGATSYNIYISTASGVTKTNWEKQGSANGSPTVITGLINEIPHYFVITAVNAAGESAESPEVSATPASPRWTISSGYKASRVAIASDKSIYAGGISKFNSEGVFLWARNTNDDNQIFNKFSGIKAKNEGLYISHDEYDASISRYRSSVDRLNPATGDILWSAELSPSCGDWLTGLAVNEYGVFAAGLECIAGLDFNGNILGYGYIPNLSGSGGSGGINSIITDGTNIYVAGNTAGDSFAPNAGGQDLFLAKYDQNGNLLWGKQWGGIDFELEPSLCLDASSGNIFVANGGWFHNAADLPGNERYLDLKLTRLDMSGNITMEKTFPDTKGVWETALECENGKVYLGYASYTSGWAQSTIINLDQDGAILWSKALPGGNNVVNSNAIAVDSESEKIFLGVGGEKLLIYSLTGEPLN